MKSEKTSTILTGPWIALPTPELSPEAEVDYQTEASIRILGDKAKPVLIPGGDDVMVVRPIKWADGRKGLCRVPRSELIRAERARREQASSS